ncbi:hypothetical protein L4B77_19595 [Vibrio minamisatsumaniensis]
MNIFRSSLSLLNIVIKTKVRKAFLTGIDTDYQVDTKWLEHTIDRLIYTLNARLIASGESIDLEDDEFIDECINAIVIQISQNIERGIKKVT